MRYLHNLRNGSLPYTQRAKSHAAPKLMAALKKFTTAPICVSQYPKLKVGISRITTTLIKKPAAIASTRPNARAPQLSE